jgi:uncharacterized protein YdhG (YjbR/CyaY superfamily)
MEEWFERLAAPARRALEGIGVRKLADISNHTYSEIAGLHGIGKNALGAIQDVLDECGADFRDEDANREIDDYIATFGAPVRERLVEMRNIIRSRIPKAKERMAYGMPTYSYGENVVHFAGFKNHIGFFPTPSGIAPYEEELKEFAFSKGGIQFPLGRALPKSLIEKIVDFRMRETRGVR